MFKKLIIVLGPTSSGKSEMAVRLAKKYQGEIISADSRQVYKGMNIGTGKVLIDKLKVKSQKDYFYQGIQHHLLDVASPRHRFTVIQYRKLALKAIEKVFKNGKIPILCGGTGFYIQAIIDGIIIPEVPPNYQLRKKLEKKSAKELYQIFKKLDPKRAKTIEKENPRRLIRAIEIAKKIGYVPILRKKPLPYSILLIGIKKEKKELKKCIEKRVKKMFKMGLEKEVKSLVKKHDWVSSLQTIGYYEWKKFFEEKISKNEVKQLIIQHTIQFAKRQMTWFKRDKKIKWIKDYQQAENIVKRFLKK